MSATYELVPFHEHKLLTVNQDGEVYVPLKPLVLAMGLTWESQRQRVARDPVLGKGTCILQVPSGGGPQDMLAMRLERIPGFIATIPTGHIKNPDIRNAVILFQEEAFDVLFAHFFQGKRGQPTGARSAVGATAATGDILKLVDRLKDEDQPEIKAMLYAMLEQTCSRMSLPLPEINAFGKPRPIIAEEFFAALAELRDLGVIIDLHRDPTLLAVPLKEVERAAVLHGIKSARGQPLWAALRAHVAFEMAGAVNCRDGKSRHCWVFRRDKLPLEFPAPQ